MNCPKCGGTDESLLPLNITPVFDIDEEGRPVRSQAASRVGYRCCCGARPSPSKPWSIWRKVRFALAWPLYRLAIRISDDV